MKLLKQHYFKAFTSTIIAISVVGCARSAPDLPPESRGRAAAEVAEIMGITPEDMNLSCQRIQEEKYDLAKTSSAYEAKLQSKRGQNQVAVYAGLFFLPAYLAADNNDKEKAELDANQLRYDQLSFLASINNCG